MGVSLWVKSRSASGRTVRLMDMRPFVLALVLCSGLSGQYVRRGGIPTGKTHDATGGMIVTFHGKLTELGNKDFTIETEDQPAFVIERSRKTKFLKDGKVIKPEQIAVGAALTVDVMKDPDLHPIAVSVMVDPPPAKPAQDQK
jgi:hypothetical protein